MTLAGNGAGGVVGAIAVKMCIVPTKVSQPAAAAVESSVSAAGAAKADVIAAEAGKAYRLKKVFYDLAGGDLVVSKEELLNGIQVGCELHVTAYQHCTGAYRVFVVVAALAW